MSGPSQGEVCGWHYASGQPLCLRWRGGTITELEPPKLTPPRDVWIAPALFDAQVNGYGGVDFQQDHGSAEDLLSARRQLRAPGLAPFLLTPVTDDWTK